MKNTALITGASNGIGLELARVHASKGGNLVLVARSIDKLNALKTELETTYKISVYTIGKDLSRKNAAQEVFDELAKKNITVEYLMNNAGFGDYGMFYETDWNKEEQMINLNVTALVHFTKLFVKSMAANGKGKILNVASTASFQPGPGMAVYFATKAFVLSFSDAINNELSDKGVTVTALCPGATASGFQEAAAMQGSKLFEGKKLPTSKEVAEYGYAAMLKGKAVAIHGFMNMLIATSVRFSPRPIVLKITRKLMQKAMH
ncbi:MAG: SDR family oxidoreductase [Bacteroidia bacterium]|nr:SDR family oxidoreductase [Bacteroidia bacterium]